ncbi:MAG: hypothetical protein JO092_05585 [Candidatus Eremiobacteraeota bacterium]|nr:hypothetical protein [Candidatus Eremiobacteraeota bacterium]
MRFRAGVAAVALALSWATAARAQIAEPTPTPDPLVYSDPAMNFTAPEGAVLMGRRELALKDLSQDLQVVSQWVIHPGKEDARVIAIAMESYEGPPNQWEAQFESQTHNQQDGSLIRNQTPMGLLNGMPAHFVEVTYGSGFDSRKEYAIVWADGVRGVVLSLTARVGDVSADEAKRLLQKVTAVRYPFDQP